MPRQNRRRDAAPRPVGSTSTTSTERFAGIDYTVRTVTGGSATKPYRCPGCDQLIAAGVPHLVVWPYGGVDAADRRHWHRPCWAARERRRPGR